MSIRDKDPNVAALWDKCKKYGIEADTNVRWKEGIDHHPKAIEIFRMIYESDWAFNNDFFRWKKGGDDKNGEILMYALSVYCELIDAELADS